MKPNTRENFKLILQSVAIVLTILFFLSSSLTKIENRLTKLETTISIFHKGDLP